MTDLSDIFNPLDDDVFDLRGEARDNVIRNLLQSPRWADISASQARRTFRDSGFSFRDSTFNNIFREVMGNIGLPTRINTVSLDNIPLEDHFFDSQYGLPTRYRYTIRYTFNDALDGTTRTDFISLNTDELTTIGETLASAEDVLTRYPDVQFSDNIMGIEVERGFIDRSK